MTRYFVSSDKYSDYGVVALIPEGTEDQLRADLDKAQDGMDSYGELRIEAVEEFADTTVHRYQRYGRSVWIDRSGSFVQTENDEWVRPEVSIGPPLVEACKVEVCGMCGKTFGIMLVVEGNDVERCRRAYAEHRAQILAQPDVATLRAHIDFVRANPDRRDSYLSYRSEGTDGAFLDVLREAIESNA